MNSSRGNPNVHSDAEFEHGMSGGCLCGSIKVTIHDSDLFTRRRGHLCHCVNCRKASGSFAAALLIIEADKVQIEDASGTLKVYKDYDSTSGLPVMRYFCREDGCPIKGETEQMPGMVILKMGLFPRIPAPEMESFVLHRHPWQVDLKGTIKYKTLRGGETLGKPFFLQFWSSLVGSMNNTCNFLRRRQRSKSTI
ncbi:Mss4-like protein [Xylariaceae sp. FL1019]|nr:Mss4-like protein [Xylariaceae sp. FL1019]